MTNENFTPQLSYYPVGWCGFKVGRGEGERERYSIKKDNEGKSGDDIYMYTHIYIYPKLC